MIAKIYVDVLFCINLFMNFFLLWIVSVLSKKKSGFIRKLFSSFVLSFLYCMTFFFPHMTILYSIPGCFCLLSIGIGIAFKPKSWKEFASLLCMSYGVSFAVGGVCMAIFFLTGYSKLIGEGMYFTIKHFPFKVLLASTGVCYIVLKIGKEWIEANITNHRDFCTTIIQSKGKEISVRMLVDTGNGLKDPFTGHDVIIASFSAIQELFSQEIRSMFFQEKIDETEFAEYIIQKERSIPFRFIPFSSVGKEHGLLLTFRPEKVTLIMGKSTLERRDIIIGVYRGDFHGYYGLVNPDTLQRYSLEEAV